MTWEEMTERERDAWLAEHLDGWKWATFCKSKASLLPPWLYKRYVIERPAIGWTDGKTGRDVGFLTEYFTTPEMAVVFPHYTTDLSAAFGLLEEMRKKGFLLAHS